MKKFTKFFLLALCTGFSLLGFSNAQDEREWENSNMNYDWIETPEKGDCSQYQCGINLLGFISQKLLIWIGIALGIMLIILYIKAGILSNKFNNTKDTGLFRIPILNIYPISKITIGSVRFFCLMLMLGFFIYGLYISLHNNKCCFHNPSQREYCGIVVGICSIILVGVLLSKLSYLVNSSQEDSDKKIPSE